MSLTLDVVRVAFKVPLALHTGFEPMTDLCATAGVRSCDVMVLVTVQRCSGGIPVPRGTHPVRGRSVPYMVRYVRTVLPGMCVMWEWLSPGDIT